MDARRGAFLDARDQDCAFWKICEFHATREHRTCTSAEDPPRHWLVPADQTLGTPHDDDRSLRNYTHGILSRIHWKHCHKP